MTGWEVARRLRQTPGCADAVLVAVTGSTHRQDTQRSRDAGFRSHLLKPVEPDELRALLESLRGAPRGPVAPPAEKLSLRP